MRKPSGNRSAVALYILPFLLLFALAGYSACLAMRINRLDRQAANAVVDWQSLYNASHELFEFEDFGPEAEQAWHQRLAALDASMESLRQLSQSWLFQRQVRDQVQAISSEWLVKKGDLEARMQQYRELSATAVAKGPTETSLKNLLETTAGERTGDRLQQANLAGFHEPHGSMPELAAVNAGFSTALVQSSIAISSTAHRNYLITFTISVILAVLIFGLAFLFARRSGIDLRTTNIELDKLNDELNAANEELVSVNEELEAQYQELSATADKLLVTERTLRASENSLRSIFRAAPAGIGMVIDRIIVQANERLCEMTGYSSDELIGKSSRVLYPGQEEFDWVGTEKYRQISAQGTGTVETSFLRKDGGKIDILLSSAPIDRDDLTKGVTFTALDITERKRAENELARAQALLQSVFEQSPVPMVIINTEGTVELLNNACLEFLGIQDEVEARPGKNFFEFERTWQDYYADGKPVPANELPIMKALSGEPTVGLEMSARRKDGAKRWEVITATPVFAADGSMIAAFAVFPEITKRKLAEEALRYSEEFNRAIIDSSPLGISVRDKTGQLISYNEAWREIWAMPDEAIQNDLTRKRVELSFDDLDFYLGEWQESVWNIYKLGGALHIPKVQAKSSRPGAAEWVAQYFYAIQDDRGEVDRVVILTEDITQRVQTEEELQHHRDNLEQLVQERAVEVERFKCFVDTSGEGMGWADLKGNIKYANSALCEMLELEKGETLLASQSKDYYPVEYWQDIEQVILPDVLKRGSWSGDLPMITAKNNLLSTRQNIFTLLDHEGNPACLANVISDLTLRKQHEDNINRLNLDLTNANRELTSLNEDFLLINQELTAANDMLVSSREALVESEERLKAILDNSTAVIYLKDASGRYLLVNRTFEALFNVSQQECVGKFASDIFPRDVADAMSVNERQVLSAEQPMQFEETVPHRDGNYTYISIKFPLRDASGEIYSVCSLSTDITELARTRYQAEEASRAKSQFLAKMSHELRTPLSAINGFASILLEQHCGPLNEQQVQYVEWMLSSGDHLLGIINDLLDLAKIEAGKMAIMRTPLDLGQLSRETYDMFAESLDDRKVRLALEIPNEMVLVSGDPTRLKQVLLNLMSNAVKFTAEGRITVYLRLTGGRVRWGVKDTGVGIQSEDLAKLFKPFEQVSEDLSAKRSGTGLGLALSREIILAHGGDISVESEAGRGSDFFVIFELDKV